MFWKRMSDLIFVSSSDATLLSLRERLIKIGNDSQITECRFSIICSGEEENVFVMTNKMAEKLVFVSIRLSKVFLSSVMLSPLLPRILLKKIYTVGSRKYFYYNFFEIINIWLLATINCFRRTVNKMQLALLAPHSQDFRWNAAPFSKYGSLKWDTACSARWSTWDLMEFNFLCTLINRFTEFGWNLM